MPHTDFLIHTLPVDILPDTFWQSLTLPHQVEDEEVEFCNPTVAAQWFARKTGDIAHLAGLAELIEQEIANYRVHQRRAERDLKTFSRKLLAKHYKRITKGANSDIQHAFLHALAAEEQQHQDLLDLEGAIEDLKQRIEVREPRRDQFYARLKSLKDAMDAARQFLDYSKLEMRIDAAVNGMRV